LITLLGFMLMIFALALVIIYCPDLETPLPGAFYVVFSACAWIYSTFDNVDGKQARRTGTSSPLGELFDHGCDALNCWVMGLVQLATLCMGTGKLASIFMVICRACIIEALHLTFTSLLGILSADLGELPHGDPLLGLRERTDGGCHPRLCHRSHHGSPWYF
jgi:phosphatidylglycerophosphate synthase